MAFPDDYKRVQQAGGPASEVNAMVPLTRQLVVDTDSFTVRIGDGTTPGGRPLVGGADFPDYWEDMPAGTFDSVGAPLPSGQVPDTEPKNWTPATLRSLFGMAFTLVSSTAWTIKESVLPQRIQEYSGESNDLNLASKTGNYLVNPSAAANLPPDAPASTNARMMLKVQAQSGSNFIQILRVRDGTNRVWQRSKVNDTFEPWVLTGGITSVDLATKVSKAGDSMTGRLLFAASAAIAASFKIPSGIAPAAPEDGDVWNTGSNLFVRLGSVTNKLFRAGDTASAAEIKAGTVADKPVSPDQLKLAAPGLVHGNWQDVGSSRLRDTTYQNTTGKWLLVIVGVTASGASAFLYYSVDGSTMIQIDVIGGINNPRVFGMIPPGAYYRATASAGTLFWYESVGAL